MDAVTIIEKKRDGHTLSEDEIRFFVQGYAEDRIPDYQAAAWAMAVYFQGMSVRETAELTMALVSSGETIDLSAIGATIVDKHSTGGVGDKTTLVVAPLVAATGVPVAKMSGRGLGFSGGTLDKLESIPGYNCTLSQKQFLELVQTQGIAVTGQTAQLVPADGKLYGLRDVTGTVPSLPLIASSIMSKKIAGGADAIVLDVKVGSGAFMETVAEAHQLAERMIAIGRQVGRRVSAVLADMSQPLGHAVGNTLEVIEAIETLKGNGPTDLQEHCLTIGAEMLCLVDKAPDAPSAREQLEAALASGQALETFRQWIAGQGGDPHVIEDYALLPQAPVSRTLCAPEGGYLAGLDARTFGLTAVALGAGREIKGAAIDHGVGIVLHAKVGDYLDAGDHLLTVHASSNSAADDATRRLLRACRWSEDEVTPPPPILEIIRKET